MNEMPIKSVRKPKKLADERVEREKLVLWRRPVMTLYYSALQLYYHGVTSFKKLLSQKLLLAFSSIMIFVLYIVIKTDGPHQQYLIPLLKKLMWCSYWIGLGILSSIGFGSGLHTFVLYLGPHIASVTLAAYECNSLDFPEPPYPDEIVCPEKFDPKNVISIFEIMSKVRLEAMMWGAGTALGELPPYFMARAGRLCGYDPDDKDDLREFQELQRMRDNPELMGLWDRAKIAVEKMVETVGFFGILACASIPNPLFDLAGFTCGHCLVPFWTFFGATLIGKAVIKMHIQKLFVIIAFNESLIDQFLNVVQRLPYIGGKLQEPFKEYLVKQKVKLHRNNSQATNTGGNVLGSIIEGIAVVMILYFVVSIINSLAQSYHKRLSQSKKKKLSKD